MFRTTEARLTPTCPWPSKYATQAQSILISDIEGTFTDLFGGVSGIQSLAQSSPVLAARLFHHYGEVCSRVSGRKEVAKECFTKAANLLEGRKADSLVSRATLARSEAEVGEFDCSQTVLNGIARDCISFVKSSSTISDVAPHRANIEKALTIMEGFAHEHGMLSLCSSLCNLARDPVKGDIAHLVAPFAHRIVSKIVIQNRSKHGIPPTELSFKNSFLDKVTKAIEPIVTALSAGSAHNPAARFFACGHLYVARTLGVLGARDRAADIINMQDQNLPNQAERVLSRLSPELPSPGFEYWEGAETFIQPSPEPQKSFTSIQDERRDIEFVLTLIKTLTEIGDHTTANKLLSGAVERYCRLPSIFKPPKARAEIREGFFSSIAEKGLSQLTLEIALNVYKDTQSVGSGNCSGSAKVIAASLLKFKSLGVEKKIESTLCNVEDSGVLLDTLLDLGFNSDLASSQSFSKGGSHITASNVLKIFPESNIQKCSLCQLAVAKSLISKVNDNSFEDLGVKLEREIASRLESEGPVDDKTLKALSHAGYHERVRSIISNRISSVAPDDRKRLLLAKEQLSWGNPELSWEIVKPYLKSISHVGTGGGNFKSLVEPAYIMGVIAKSFTQR